MIDVLIKYGANIDKQSLAQETPLFVAAQADRPLVIMKLFKYGANLNLANVHGRTPLVESASRDYLTTTWTLLDVGVELNTTANIESFSTALIRLKFHERVDLKPVIRLLLDAGCIIRSEWLRRMNRFILGSRCLSLMRMYEHMMNAHSLQALCVRSIRNSIAKPVSQNMERLVLPMKLKERICFNEYLEDSPVASTSTSFSLD